MGWWKEEEITLFFIKGWFYTILFYYVFCMGDFMIEFLMDEEPTEFAIEKITQVLIHHCQKLGASDIFINTGTPIFINVNGRKYPVTRRPCNDADLLSIIDQTRNVSNSESLLGSGLALNYAYSFMPSRASEYSIRVRCNATKMDGKGNFNLVARLINSVPPTVQALKVEQCIIDAAKNSTQGMILLCGATGSGKSTTLASIIRFLLEQEDGNHHFIDIGAPIEYCFDDIYKPSSIVTTISVPDSLPTFQDAIAECMRKAPTMIQVTEMRDTPTLLAGMEASKTGHLLFSTLHANNTVLAIKRMLSLLPVGMQNSGELDIIDLSNMFVAQVLAPTVDGKRCAIREIFTFDADVRQRLYQSKNIVDDCTKILGEYGRPMSVDIEEKYKDGIISKETRDKLNMNYQRATLDAKGIKINQ